MNLRETIYKRIFEQMDAPIFYHGSAYLFDRFDMDKVGTGYELNKFGFGLYFSTTLAQAEFYANQAVKGKPDADGQWIYEVKLFETDTYLEWEDHIPLSVHQKVSEKLRSMGKEEDADMMDQELEDYGDTWSMRSAYEIMVEVLGSARATSEFMYDCGVGGVITDAVVHKAQIYTCFAEDRIKIVDRYLSQYDGDPTL